TLFRSPTLDGGIDEIMPDGRFGVMLDNRHRIIAYTAGKMRRLRIRSVVGDRVHVEMTPYDPTKGRIILRERTPGQGPGARRGGFQLGRASCRERGEVSVEGLA